MSKKFPGVGGKKNGRKFTGGGPRPDNTAYKQQEAKGRDAAWAALTPLEQIASLDRRLGKGLGAVKQRSKVALRLAAGSKPVAKQPVAAPVAVAPKLKAKDRRAIERGERPGS